MQRVELHGFLRRGRMRWEAWAALRQARGLRRSNPAGVRVCWDLDNTLVDSGTLLRHGARLQDAVVDAQPVPNMIDFFEAVRKKLPDAEHVIVSARGRSMRHATNAWLQHHGVAARSSAICFVPYAEAKVRVWEQLAQDARLVIVDDLCYGHENEQPRRYLELIEIADRTASVYIGCDKIAQIAASPTAVESIAWETVMSLGGT